MALTCATQTRCRQFSRLVCVCLRAKTRKRHDCNSRSKTCSKTIGCSFLCFRSRLAQGWRTCLEWAADRDTVLRFSQIKTAFICKRPQARACVIHPLTRTPTRAHARAHADADADAPRRHPCRRRRSSMFVCDAGFHVTFYVHKLGN